MARTFIIVDRRQIPERKPFYESIEEAAAALMHARKDRPGDPETLVLVAVDPDGAAGDVAVDVIDGADVSPAPDAITVRAGQRAP